MRFHRFQFTFFTLTFLFSCQEKEIPIPELTVGNRRVLVEELTGVRCPNCPDGTKVLTKLDSIYGEGLIIVAVHAAGTFSVPYSDPPANQYDFRFPEAQQMADYIGSPFGFPTAAVNRSDAAGNGQLFLFSSLWGGVIAQESQGEPLVGLYLNRTWDAETRQLEVQANISPDQSLSGEYRLTVLITQDSIVDAQQVNLVRVGNYVHRHTLRGILTAPTGDVIDEPLLQNGLVVRRYNFALPPEWVAKHCRVIAFVHRGGNPNKEVLQATEIPIE